MTNEAMQGGSKTGLIAIGVAIIIVAAAVGGWLVGRGGSEPAEPPPPPVEPVATEVDATEDATEVTAAADEETLRWRSIVRDLPGWPSGELDEATCEVIEADAETVCARRDDALCDIVRSAAISLARNRPVPSGELYEYDDVLQNAFHVFRVVGRQRVTKMASSLANAGQKLEPEALVAYRWLASRQACGEGEERAIDLRAMHDYGVWALSTLGGQAYLHRRSPRVEGLASFYALLAIDRAISAGQDPHGFDPRPHVGRVGALLDDGSLLFHEAYMDVIDRFKERWRVP
jgi:hypothetical protein